MVECRISTIPGEPPPLSLAAFQKSLLIYSLLIVDSCLAAEVRGSYLKPFVFFCPRLVKMPVIPFQIQVLIYTLCIDPSSEVVAHPFQASGVIF